MTNPDVTHGEEVTTWAWIAGAVVVTVFLAAFAFSNQNMQVASYDPLALPPVTYPSP
jgi:hypothetical protein